MLRLVLVRARVRLGAGLLIALTLPLWLPAQPSHRLWVVAALGLLAPWLVLGRDRGRAREGLRAALRSAPRGGLLALAELLPALVVVWFAALIGASGVLTAALALFAWGAGLVALADALDRRVGRAGPAWVVVLVLGLAVFTAPLWLAPFFGRVPWAPWLGTAAVGLHPAAAALTAAGHPALQDAVFYTYTLSGVHEVRPLPWTCGTAFFGLAALAGAIMSMRAVRRPQRSFVS